MTTVGPARGVVALAVLDRIVAGREPDYPIHGQTSCIACHQWVWLDAGSLQPVVAGELLPVCKECAYLHIPGMSQIGNQRGRRR